MYGLHYKYFSVVSRFTTILSQWGGSPWYQVLSKNAETQFLLISETWWCSIKKKMFLKILQHRKAPVPESLCKLQLYLKRDSPDDSVHWGMSPPKKHHPPLSCQVPPLKSANCRNGRGVGGGWGFYTMGTQRVFLRILEDFKNTFLTEHLWMAASILKDIFFIFFD